MAASRNFLQPGKDVTHASCVTLSDLVQMFIASYPAADIGYIITSAIAPNVVEFPELSRFLWFKPPDQLYVYNGAQWVILPVGVGSVGTEQIKDNSITIKKLKVGNGLPLQLIRVSNEGDEFEFVDWESLIGQITAGSIIPATTNSVLVTLGGVSQWENFIDFMFRVEDEIKIQPSKIVTTGSQPKQVLMTNGTATWKWVEEGLRPNVIMPDRLKFPTGSAGKTVKVNSAATDFEYVVQQTSGSRTSVIRYHGLTSGGNPQFAAPGSPKRLMFDSIMNAQNDIISLDTTTGDFLLSSGIWLIDAAVQLTMGGSDAEFASIQLKDMDADVVIATSNCLVSDQSEHSAFLKHAFSVTAATTLFSLQVARTNTQDDAMFFGFKSEIDIGTNTYQQAILTKLA